MKQKFVFAHVGINCDSEAAAIESAAKLERIFGLSIRNGNTSVFAGNTIEITKKPFRGKHGHLAFTVRDVEQAIDQLRDLGVSIIDGSEKYKEGRLVAVYIDLDIVGFAVHLLASPPLSSK